MVTILLFAGLAEAAGAPSVELELALPARVSEARKALAERITAAAERLSACIAAVNHEFAGDEAWIRPGDEVAFLPPVSGG